MAEDAPVELGAPTSEFDLNNVELLTDVSTVDPIC